MTEVLRQAVGDAGMLPASDMASFSRLLDERGGGAVVPWYKELSKMTNGVSVPFRSYDGGM